MMKPIKRTEAEKEELKQLQKEFLLSQARADFYECNRQANKESN